MSWISEIFTNSVGTVVDSVGKAVDSLVTSDEERLQLKNALMQIEVDAKNKTGELSLKIEEEITKRWTSDNDHIVTRLTRPAIVLWGFTLLTIVMLLDGNVGEFTINEAYIPLLETIVVTSVVAYMGGRSVEKVSKVVKK